ncbi:MAG TPA: cupin domain-containing protein [Spirochaetota bacterium]|nr:cupin domain-containing protein [Spirochaetota bacterium]HPH03494.1 cupin domain-containing protein [Spirochaetota bacterium]HPN83141.1 cupin domain-containing protein [Spirochaetota bacterium]
MIPSLLHLLEDLPDAQSAEVIEILAESPGVRIERIVSGGQASPPGFWYDQDEHEWVMLLSGTASLRWEDGTVTVLETGEALEIPPHLKHRVENTTDQTVWLAVFWSQPI